MDSLYDICFVIYIKKISLVKAVSFPLSSMSTTHCASQLYWHNSDQLRTLKLHVLYARYKSHLDFFALLCNYTTSEKVEGLSFLQTGKHIMYKVLYWATE